MARRLTQAIVMGLLLTVGGTGVSAKETLSFALNVDPSHAAVTYAIRTGKVKSDKVNLEIHALDINTIIQSVSTKRFDITEVANTSVVRGVTQGLPIKMLGTAIRVLPGNGYDLWVRKDSPIKTANDLKGKRLGVFGLSSSAATLVRVALWKHFGLNVATQGGDIIFNQMQVSALPGALAAGNIDAALLIQSQAYQASKSGAFRSIVNTAEINTKLFGAHPVSAVLIGYPEKIAGKQESYREALKLILASARYAVDHQDEVFGAVAAEDHVDKEFLVEVLTRYLNFPVAISDDDVKALDIFWALSKELGLLKQIVPAASTIWDGAIRN